LAALCAFYRMPLREVRLLRLDELRALSEAAREVNAKGGG